MPLSAPNRGKTLRTCGKVFVWLCAECTLARDLEPYHIAWLDKHPERDIAWLRDRMRDGFDIHHIDGDHSNNDPANLVLIEHLDHIKLHGMPGSMSRMKKRPKTPPEVLKARRLERAALAKEQHLVDVEVELAQEVLVIAEPIPPEPPRPTNPTRHGEVVVMNALRAKAASMIAARRRQVSNP